MNQLAGRFGKFLIAGAVVAGTVLVPTAARAFIGVPENVRFVEITNDHVDLTFVDMSTTEIEFRIDYKVLGTITWNTVRTVRDHRTGQPGATGVTIRVNDLPHNSVGGCYKVWAVGTSASLGTAQKCTAEVPYAMKMARMGSWTQTSESSYDGWNYGRQHQRLYEEFEFTWATDYCSSSPDEPSGFDFRLSCYRHDFGYRNYKRLNAFDANKSRVDSAFYADMLRKCDTYLVLVRPVCYGLGAAYYEAVVLFGDLVVGEDTLAYHANWKAELLASAQQDRSIAS